MTTVLTAAQPEEVRNLLRWALQFAASRSDDLVIVLPQRGKGPARLKQLPDIPEQEESELVSAARATLRAACSDGSGSNPGDGCSTSAPPESNDPELRLSASRADQTQVPSIPQPVRLYQLAGQDWSTSLADQLTDLTPSLVIVPAPTISKEQKRQDDWQTLLLDRLDCEVILLQDDAFAFERNIRIAVFVSDNSDNEAALQCGMQLSAGTQGAITAVFMEPNIGDFASAVGSMRLDELLGKILSRAERDGIHQKVAVVGSPTEMFAQLDMSDYDLLLFSPSGLREMRRFLSASPASDQADSIPAMAVVRRGHSFSTKLRNRVGRWLRSFVPQLSREERVELVSRIQSSSQWDFDFIFLVSLATLIACLGLAENSGAVIVGAMLVAPLMTPIAGVGLGVAHANSFLTKTAFRTALRGFATAMLIGILFGLCVQGAAALEWLQPLQSDFATAVSSGSGAFPREMENRMRPQFYDLLIALASGVAAAYAMGRPNLFSALPGVAIAAALVPPIATSGIALSHGHIVKGGGALLLFLTNMVTIILGASLVFRAVGIRSPKKGPAVARWPRYTLLLLVILSVLITIIIEVHQRSGR